MMFWNRFRRWLWCFFPLIFSWFWCRLSLLNGNIYIYMIYIYVCNYIYIYIIYIFIIYILYIYIYYIYIYIILIYIYTLVCNIVFLLYIYVSISIYIYISLSLSLSRTMISEHMRRSDISQAEPWCFAILDQAAVPPRALEQRGRCDVSFSEVWLDLKSDGWSPFFPGFSN